MVSCYYVGWSVWDLYIRHSTALLKPIKLEWDRVPELKNSSHTV